jgi:hypothetical protein
MKTSIISSFDKNFNLHCTNYLDVNTRDDFFVPILSVILSTLFDYLKIGILTLY